MATITFSPIIYERFRRKDGTYNVRIRMTVNRQSRQISTTIYARPDQLTKSLKVKDRSIQKRIDEMLASLRQKTAQIDPLVVSSLSADDVMRIISRQDGEFSLDFMSFASAIIDEIAKRNKKSAGHYRYAINSLREFTQRESLDISKITSTFLRNYERWMRGKYGDKARAVSLYTSAIAYIHRQARLRYNDDETGQLKIRNPYEYYHPPKQVQTKHRAISTDSIQQIINAVPHLTRAMERRAASLYLISFGMMGINLPDLYDCAAPDGNAVVIYHRRKTRDRRQDDAEMRVRIDERILPLIKRMSGEGRLLDISSRFTFPAIENQVTRNLPLAARSAGVQERVTFYTARHTWATLAYKIGIEKGIINDCLCHIDEAMKVTDIYIEKDWERLWEANRRVLDCFDWTPLSQLVEPLPEHDGK